MYLFHITRHIFGQKIHFKWGHFDTFSFLLFKPFSPFSWTVFILRHCFIFSGSSFFLNQGISWIVEYLITKWYLQLHGSKDPAPNNINTTWSRECYRLSDIQNDCDLKQLYDVEVSTTWHLLTKAVVKEVIFLRASSICSAGATGMEQ